MKKRIIAVTAIFMIGLILTGCGGTGITKDSKSADILNYLNKVENKDGSWSEKPVDFINLLQQVNSEKHVTA